MHWLNDLKMPLFFWLMYSSCTPTLAQNTEKPANGVAVQMTITVVNNQTACVLVTAESEQPAQWLSVDWLDGEWQEDPQVDCSFMSTQPTTPQLYSFTAQIPAQSAYQPVSVQVTWLVGGDVFSAVQTGSATPQWQMRQIQKKENKPADPNSLFIIRIGK